ncbi:MAG: 3-oxoacyl-[acyl-carrier-protein] reductase [Pseudomonadota bacterium]|nr:3-oxoacyl-[acyl-carrier-protein] reductase [Pseudomonadota bacterium]MDE3037792.1 3-oxoacyl-[acyl-carrier-protein] reductase [Pseudomonadota bacterium]
MFTLENKKALVTGATGGIGGAIVHALHQAGAHVVASGSNQEKLDHLIGGMGDNIFAIACNLAALETTPALVEAAEEKLGGLDILICNAGVTKDNLALRMKDEEWNQVIDVNLTASFKLARAAMKGMLKRRQGRIIFITSVVGHTGNPGQANYCASKAGLAGMAKSLAQEVASRGITVNCIAPGFIETAMTAQLNDEQKARINQNIPLGRMGLAGDVAAGALFLASGEAAYITGHTLHVNGGLFMA